VARDSQFCAGGPTWGGGRGLVMRPVLDDGPSSGADRPGRLLASGVRLRGRAL